MPLPRPFPWPLLCTLAALPGLAVLAPAACADPGGGPLTVEDLVMLKRLSDPQVAPDGRSLAFVARETDMAGNRGRNAIWLLDLAHAGATAQRLTEPQDNASSPRWASDGRTLYFLGSQSGSAQVWRLTPGAAGARQVTNYPLDVDAFKVSPRGDALALAIEVFPDCATLGCTKERLSARSKEPARARSYDRLFIRHWDTWSEGTRSHLFAARLNADGTAGEPVDLAKGFDADTPGKPFGGDEDFAFSPDGRTLVFAARSAGRSESWSTNFDLFQAPADGSAAPVNLTADNKAADAQPVFLANGDLAWLAQERPGFESDRFHIVVKSARDGAVRPLTAAWDRSVARLGATADGKWLLASADDLGQRKLYRIDPKSGLRFELANSGEVDDFTATASQVLFARADLAGPNDLYQVAVKGGAVTRLTEANRELLGARHLSAYEQFSFKGWNAESVHGYVMQPYGFEPGKRFPVAFVVHGGPQSSFQNLWTYRWNAQTFAAAGYGVVMIDFHGSPGYGQAFTDSISHDWGGKPLVDLQKGLEAALAKYPWLDGERVCALGASYGGFMMNWIEGNWPERFRCIVNHDGVFDQRMMYYSTEELWFPEWEFGGPYWQNPQGYERWNPVDFVAKWKTPMLVIHGEQDFRIPYSQGIGAFTALQRRGIESKLLVFPSENHWVLKPADSVLWYHTVIDWLDGHLKQ